MKINRTFLRSKSNKIEIETIQYEYSKTSKNYIIQMESNKKHIPIGEINKISCSTSMGIQASQWWFEEENTVEVVIEALYGKVERSLKKQETYIQSLLNTLQNSKHGK